MRTFGLKLFTFLLFCAVTSYTQDNKKDSTPNGSVVAIQKDITVSDAYYWLSRSRNNRISDIHKAKTYALAAQEKLNKAILPVAETEALTFQIETLIGELEAQENLTASSMTGFSGIMGPLLNPLPNAEWFTSGYQEVVESSLADLSSRAKLGKVPMYLIPLADDKDHNLEEIAHKFFNETTSCYVLTKHELATTLSKDELASLYGTPPRVVMEKIAESFKIATVGIVNLSQPQTEENLLWAGQSISVWNASKKTFSTTVSGSAVIEVLKTPWYLSLLIALGVPLTFLYNKVNPKSKGNYSPIWLMSAVMVVSAAIGFLTVQGLHALDINATVVSLSPSGIGWLALSALLFSLIPMVMVYVISSKIPGIAPVLNNPETASTLFFGTYAGSLLCLSVLACSTMGYTAIPPLVLPLLAVYLVGISFGKTFSKYAISSDHISMAVIIALLLAMPVVTLGILKLSIVVSAVTSAVLIFYSILIPLVIPKVHHWMAASKEVGGHEELVGGGIKRLRHILKNPPFYSTPWKSQFEEATKFIVANDDSKIEVVFIEADQGCGKTRIARELADSVAQAFAEKQKTTTILFGDCDEFANEGDVIPYEPFIQALSDHLGVGRFMNPAEKAEKLRSGLVGAGLNAAMTMGGMGVISSLLDAEESEKTRKSNINEIVTVIAETFVELAANGKVIFILDDTQWIDPESLELFKLLLIKLDKDFNDNEVSFILTSRPVAPTDSMKELLAELANSINLDCTLNQDLLEKPEMVEGILESLRMDYRCRTSFSRYLLENGISRPLQILQFLEAAIDSDMIEAIGEVFALKSDSDLKKLPPPRDFQRMVEEHVSGLPAKLLDILQCCALMGRSFKASIVSRIFNIDLLELLTLFKNAEERNIICDVESEDDVFDFVDKRMVAVFRRLNSGATVAVSEALSQKVREYHKRFLQYKEQELKEMNLAEEDYPYRDLISLAAHSKAIADTNPEKAVQLNRLAGLRTYEKGMFQAATGYFETAVNLVDKHPGKYDPITEARLYLSYAKCLLDEQSNLDTVKELLAKGSKALENLADEKAATILPELNIVSALVAYRSRQFAEATELATKVVQSEKATVFEVLRARFYIAASLPIDQPEERFSQHTNLIHDIRERLKQENSPREERELQCVLSEALNNTGFIALFGLKDLAKAIPYFEKAIECNELPQVNDQKGIAIAHGGLGDCYSQLDKIQEAEVHYTTNLGISRNTGDLQGIGRMTSMLGALKLKEASTDGEGTESLIQNAFAFYDESLSISDNQGNGVGQCFAIAGLLNCLAIGHVGDRETYIIQKAKKIAQSPNYSKIPDFATSALVAALQKNREQNNSIEEVLVQLEK